MLLNMAKAASVLDTCARPNHLEAEPVHSLGDDGGGVIFLNQSQITTWEATAETTGRLKIQPAMHTSLFDFSCKSPGLKLWVPPAGRRMIALGAGQRKAWHRCFPACNLFHIEAQAGARRGLGHPGLSSPPPPEPLAPFMEKFSCLCMYEVRGCLQEPGCFPCFFPSLVLK